MYFVKSYVNYNYRSDKMNLISDFINLGKVMFWILILFILEIKC